MKLDNPPVVEAWVEFRFGLGEESPPWNEAIAEKFLEEALAGSYRSELYGGIAEFVLENTGGRTSLKDSKYSFDRIRAVRTDSDDKYLQVGRGLLVCNLVRKQKAWPKFETLREEALNIIEKYCDFFKPKKLIAAAINYRDIVSIPYPDSQKLDLQEYVRFYPEVSSDIFGQVSNFRMSCSLENAIKSGILTLSMRRGHHPEGTNPDQDNQVLLLRMDWNLISTNLQSIEVEAVRKWLNIAHDDIINVFQRAFTEKGWALFKPAEE